MKEEILSALVRVLITLLTPELLKSFAGIILKFARDFVLGTASDIDDMLVIPMIDLVERTFDITEPEDS